MADVARMAGVSDMTVSRVLNEHPGVRSVTRARVLAAMEWLDYRPNAAARALVTGRSRTLGVVSFDSTYYGPAATLLGIEQAARNAGYLVNIIMVRSSGPRTGREIAEHLRAQSFDGIILAAPHGWTTDAVRHLPADVPLVAIDVDETQRSVTVVGVGQSAGVVRATEYLLGLGHETVWHVAGPADRVGSPAARTRERAWRDTLVEAGRTVPPVLRGDWTARSGYEQIRSVAGRERITAVFAANDQMALGALRALREARLDVPGEVSLVGYDDVPEAAYYWPPLTTVRQDFAEVGRRGLDLLLEQIGGAPRTEQLVVVEPELVVRQSSGPPPQSQ
jgi:DNA-binding LacI/PurR family transcriptional regulator